MSGNDTFVGLSPDQQLAGIALIGVALLLVGYTSSSAVADGYDPTLVGIGWVCLLYVGIRFAYERLA